jgi:sec-independent protein translocase protein TatC
MHIYSVHRLNANCTHDMRIVNTHVKEIKYRSVYLLVSYILTLVYIFHNANVYVFAILYQSGLCVHTDFLCTYIGEGFSVSMLTAVLLAFIFTLPFVYYQIWSYIRPARYRYNTHLGMLKAVPIYLCILFCVYKGVPYVIQYVIEFFLSYERSLHNACIASQVQTQPRLLPTIIFITRILWVICCIAILIFSLPFIFKDLPLDIRTRLSAYAIAIIFASLLAPPEVYLQISITMIFGCIIESSILLALYLSIYYAKTANKR